MARIEVSQGHDQLVGDATVLRLHPVFVNVEVIMILAIPTGVQMQVVRAVIVVQLQLFAGADGLHV